MPAGGGRAPGAGANCGGGARPTPEGGDSPLRGESGSCGRIEGSGASAGRDKPAAPADVRGATLTPFVATPLLPAATREIGPVGGANTAAAFEDAYFCSIIDCGGWVGATDALPLTVARDPLTPSASNEPDAPTAPDPEPTSTNSFTGR